MIHLPVLIADLGLILAAAGITTLLFKKIKQPLVLGYILAGVLVGPYINFMPTVTDHKSITIWAEIGVIFLLF
ncbi:MAG: sodium:proton antiporter, partial [Pedobacter sp.]